MWLAGPARSRTAPTHSAASSRCARGAPSPGLRCRSAAAARLAAASRTGAASLEVSKGLPRGGVIFQAHGRSADDWDGPEDGEILNSGWKDRGFLARVDHQVGKGMLSVGLQSDFGRDIERPRNNSNVVRFYYPYEDSHRFTSSYELLNVAGFQQMRVTGIRRHVRAADRSGSLRHGDRPGAASSAPTSRPTTSTSRAARPGLSARRASSSASTSTAATTWRRSTCGSPTTSPARSPATSPTSRSTTPAAPTRVRTSRPMHRSRSSSGCRAACAATTSPPRTPAGSSAIDRPTTARSQASPLARSDRSPASASPAQVSRGFRDPTLSDRYYRGPSGRGFITGNPDLEPETSLQYDLATRYVKGPTQLAAYFYHYRIDDLVERYQTQTDFFFFRNRGRARLRGFEFEARTALPGDVAVEVGANIGRGVALDDDANLDDISPDTVSLLVRKDFGRTCVRADARRVPRRGRSPGPERNRRARRDADRSGGGFTLRRNTSSSAPTSATCSTTPTTPARIRAGSMRRAVPPA